MMIVLFSAAVVLFFAEGGELRGINHDPNAPSKPLEHSKYAFEVVEEEIIPIYDDTVIKSVKLWGLPPKEILITLITAPMAYIPPVTAHLITLFISSLSLSFIVLYRRGNRQENGRPEQILAYLKKNPGHSLQQIADILGVHRSTTRHYLRRMEKKQTVSATDYRGHTHYFAGGENFVKTERLMYIIISQEKEKQAITIILNHPGITKQELAGKLRISRTACNWYLQRFLDDGMIMIVFDGVHNKYRLTNEAETACKKIIPNRTTTAGFDNPASGQ